MDNLVVVNSPEAVANLDLPLEIPSLDPDDYALQNPDRHVVWRDDADSSVARCSLWWNETPALKSQQLGIIGHYATTSATASANLLNRTCRILAQHGCTLAVGPMDGNTWRRYRLLTERGDEPTFFLEPDNPDDWPQHFINSGFTVLASYFSSLTTRLNLADPRINEISDRLERHGVKLRGLEVDDFERELRKIYAHSIISFKRNFLYSPINQDEFVERYLKVRPFIRPELTLMAEKQGQLVGFVFALPDIQQSHRGRPIDTILIKTLARLPDRTLAGLGSLLTARVQTNAAKLGYQRSIHALMHESNHSLTLSRTHQAEIIRRYALFARKLTR